MQIDETFEEGGGPVEGAAAGVAGRREARRRNELIEYKTELGTNEASEVKGNKQHPVRHYSNGR